MNITVVGTGYVGIVTAAVLADFGNHVCIVEGGDIGGASIYGGVVVSKTMWELSSNYSVAKRTDRGYRASGLSIDYDKVRDTVFEAAKDREYQLLSQIETFTKRADAKKSITLIRGWAKFETLNRVIVTQKDGETVEIEAENFVIATGSHPRKHPLFEIDGERIISSDHILKLKKFPSILS